MSPPPEAPAPQPKPQPKGSRPILAILLSLAGLGAVLGWVVWGLVAAWNGAGQANPGSHLSAHGWAALIIAFVMVCVVGGGLMGLAFYSARKGYDDRVSNREE